MQAQEGFTDPRRPRKPQFGMRTLLGLFVVAALLGSIFTMPEWLGGIVAFFLMLALPVILITTLIYGGGYLRTFCIGALVPTAPQVLALPFLATIWMFGGPPQVRGLGRLFEFFDEYGANVRVVFAALALVSLVTGVLAITVRWLVERSHEG